MGIRQMADRLNAALNKYDNDQYDLEREDILSIGIQYYNTQTPALRNNGYRDLVRPFFPQDLQWEQQSDYLY